MPLMKESYFSLIEVESPQVFLPERYIWIFCDSIFFALMIQVTGESNFDHGGKSVMQHSYDT